jgi:hypothetical protein
VIHTAEEEVMSVEAAFLQNFRREFRWKIGSLLFEISLSFLLALKACDMVVRSIQTTKILRITINSRYRLTFGLQCVHACYR